jgi:putative ABC transport system ATP-binding protein
MPLKTPILETVNLRKTYTQGEIPVHALRGVNLRVEKGDYIAILGPSGSGKSTLLNMIGILDRPTEGQVLIEGTDTSQLNDNEQADLRAQIGFVFQFFNLIPRLDAIGNVELALAIPGVSKTERRKRAEKLLETVGLKERVHHRPSELSGGERQRVAIARALANNPKFLLMDEPTGNIDSNTAREIMELVRGLNQKGVTAVVVTHDHNVASQAKRSVQMLDGVVIKETVN